MEQKNIEISNLKSKIDDKDINISKLTQQISSY